jgi:hypothetical protein
MSEPDTKDVNTHVPPPKPLLLSLIPLLLSGIALVLLLLDRCVPGAAFALAAAAAGAWAVASFRSNPYSKDPARPIPVPVPPVRTAQAAAMAPMARSEPDTKDPLPHIPPPRPTMMPPPVVPLVVEATFDVAVAVTVAYSSCSAAAALSVLAVLAGIVAVVQQMRSRASAGV